LASWLCFYNIARAFDVPQFPRLVKRRAMGMIVTDAAVSPVIGSHIYATHRLHVVPRFVLHLNAGSIRRSGTCREMRIDLAVLCLRSMEFKWNRTRMASRPVELFSSLREILCPGKYYHQKRENYLP
jgi:hypothetical protein